MSDVFELVLNLNLRDDLTDAELASLRWFLGLGVRPENLSILAESPIAIVDGGEESRPVLAGRGAAWKTGGALVSELVRRGNPAGWAITSRQELHPDEFDEVLALLSWLADRADYPYRDHDGTVRSGGCGNVVGYLRFYEDVDPTVLTIRGGIISWPSEYLG
ncbi:hypothetical protein AB0M79_34895 [Polymorphospora sp. NPDC051019]|uniref:hypothetical protein n=1 Tax=Polymorphospora sp. NPDC051019 TaxID=3155725 RepID=UPI003448D250